MNTNFNKLVIMVTIVFVILCNAVSVQGSSYFDSHDEPYNRMNFSSEETDKVLRNTPGVYVSTKMKTRSVGNKATAKVVSGLTVAIPDGNGREIVIGYDSRQILSTLSEEPYRFIIYYRLGDDIIEIIHESVDPTQILLALRNAVSTWNNAFERIATMTERRLRLRLIDVAFDENHSIPSVRFFLGTSGVYHTLDRSSYPNLRHINENRFSHSIVDRTEAGNRVSFSALTLLTMPNAGVRGSNVVLRENVRYLSFNYVFPSRESLQLVMGNNLDRAEHIIALQLQYEIGRILGLLPAMPFSLVPEIEDQYVVPYRDNNDQFAISVPAEADDHYNNDPMIESFRDRIESYGDRNFINDGLPPIPSQVALVPVFLANNIEHPICNRVDLERCAASAISSRDTASMTCEFVLNYCRNLQVVGNAEFNHEFKSKNIKFYTKDFRGNATNVSNFANTGTSDVIETYNGSSRYYFPFGYDKFYMSIDEIETEFYIGNVPKAKNLYGMFNYDGTKELMKEKVESHLMIAREELRNSIISDENKEENNLGTPAKPSNITGSNKYPFGIDFSFAVNVSDFILNSGAKPHTIEVYAYYKAYPDWQLWQGRIKLGICDTRVSNYNYLPKTGDCIMGLPRMFVPLATHAIVIQTVAKYALDYEEISTYEQDLSRWFGGFGIQVPNADNKVPRSIGILKFGSVGVFKFQLYKRPYPVRDDLTIFCDWPTCRFNPLEQ